MLSFKKIALRPGLVQAFSRNYEILLVDFLLLLKIFYLNFFIGVTSSLSMSVCSLAILLAFSIWTCLLTPRSRRTALFVVAGLISTLLWVDLLFYRIYHTVLSIPVLYEAGQVEGVSGSIATLINKGDIVFFIDLLLLAYLFFLRKSNKYSSPIGIVRRIAQAVLVFLICGLILGIRLRSVSQSFDQDAYIGLNWTNTVLEQMGIINYHILDLYQFFNVKDAKADFDGKVGLLKTWMEHHQSLEGTNLKGVAQGKNLIVIQLEAMQGFLINNSINGQEVTPNLNKLLKSSMYFDNYFTQIAEGTTSDAEFMSLNSLYPAAEGSYYILKPLNTYYSLPAALRNSGFTGSYAFHGYKPEFWNRNIMYPSEGFNKFYNENDFQIDEKMGMGLSDESMFRQTLSILEQKKQPFFSFIVTLTAHYPWDGIPDNKKGLNIPQGEFSDMFADYLQAQHYADESLGKFMDNLQQQGILDNSVVVIYGDHFGQYLKDEDIRKFLNSPTPINDDTSLELHKVPLLIHLPGGNYAGVRHISGGEMDLYPTLANLFGLDKGKLFYFGHDLLNIKEGFSAFRVYAPDGSFATDNLLYIANKDGIFEHGAAYDRQTGKQVDIEKARSGYQRALWHLTMSDLILKVNGLPQLLKK
ncbi:LTA synthase family protein [Desulfosporosinus sp. PR]|uniref:LTA synthase family protein n=1 Tax=Candidatus Desulfosporosinus nitrosoreducens TaxID=3401928 RepID=UPI0027F35428|nr:LTA synthase family protein [Desulfosporosinus sp. PR]MDQ7095193.1 LTA synthase family protein [Desulfosporosinus sp. PR]